MKPEVVKESLRYIESWLPFRYEHTDMPGFAVAIAHKDKVIFNETYGYADLEKKQKLTPDHLFRIASHSKTFTATALMQLVEQGRLRLDDKVVTYLPWLKKNHDKRFQNVTLRQVMSHGAGIIRDGTAHDFWQLMGEFPSGAELKKATLSTDLVIANNTKLKYSNFGYSLLGLVIEAVTGAPYNDYVSQSVVKTLGLKNTGPEYTSAIKDRLVLGYSRETADHSRFSLAPDIDTHAMSPATGFYSNAADLATYFSAHIIGSGKLLGDEAKKDMQHPIWPAEHMREKEEYGLGLEIEYVNKQQVFGHSGGFPGQVTKSMCDPKNQLVVVGLTNCIDGYARSMVRGVLSVFYYFQKHLSERKPNKDLAHFAGRFANLWSMTDFVPLDNKVVEAYPDSWYPFTEPTELKFVDDHTLKVTKTNSFLYDGELVRFKFDGNHKIASVNYAGATMWPVDEYFRTTAK